MKGPAWRVSGIPTKRVLAGGRTDTPEYFGKVINAMNFIAVGIFIDGEPLDLAKQPVADFHMELDMQRGVLNRSFLWKKRGRCCGNQVHF